MASPATQADVESRLAQLGSNGSGIDPTDIVEVVESVMASISGERTGINLRLYEDIESLSQFIKSAKSEITSLRADEIKTKYIPAASDELSAIVGATEHATNEIFEAVEAIESTANEMDPEAAAPLSDAVTRIYEACSFQDITGQRITKIVKALQDVETKVNGLLRAFGEDVPELPAEAEAPVPVAAAEEPKVKSDKDLMNGPQLPGNAMSQDEIDALMSSFD
jgi:chemotaxis protein CheZ